MEANTILNEDNYFVWEFNTRMKLAKKDLMEHLFTTESPGKGDVNSAAWKVNYMKAFANVCTMISPSLQSMVRSAQSSAEVWEILKASFSVEAFTIGSRCVDNFMSSRWRKV